MMGVTHFNIPTFLMVHLRGRKSCECSSYFVSFRGHQCCLVVLRRIYFMEHVTVLCIYLKEFVLFDKANVDLFLFMIYLRIVSVAQAMWLQVIE